MENNASLLLKSENPNTLLLLQEILSAEGPGLTAAATALAAAVTAEPSRMEMPAVHRVLKTLAHSANGDHAVARALSSALSGKFVRLASVNRSAFVVLALLESGCADVIAGMRSELMPALKDLKALATVAGAALICKVCGGGNGMLIISNMIIYNQYFDLLIYSFPSPPPALYPFA